MKQAHGLHLTYSWNEEPEPQPTTWWARLIAPWVRRYNHWDKWLFEPGYRVECELVSILAQEIRKEIDQEIIREIYRKKNEETTS